MSKTNQTDTSQITFYGSRRPVLPDGDYEITVNQELNGIATPHQDGTIKDKPFTHTQRFSICGPRFQLDPAQIHAKFPPDGGRGAYQNVLPHIMLDRCTLPWERSPGIASPDSPPWLAVLLLDDAEMQQPGAAKTEDRAFVRTTALKIAADKVSLEDSAAIHDWLPPLTKELGDGTTKSVQTVRVLSVPIALVNKVAPKWADLPFTAHARGNGAEVFSTVLAARLPKAGATNQAFLVSLEGHFNAGGDMAPLPVDAKFRSFIVLASWRFDCLTDGADFAKLLTSLSTGPLALPVTDAQNETTKSQLNAGFTGHVHALRQGNASVSWYRGPLLPGTPQTGPTISSDATRSDELARLHAASTLLDVSYAAAWELGRQLMLARKQTSVDLYHWKRTAARTTRGAANAGSSHDHLPGRIAPADDAAPPERVSQWFEATALLKGVPFNYLVPDERMLPTESIRFFQLDPEWMNNLFAGAFSIGHVAGGAARPPQCRWPLPSSVAPVSGFLLRSAVVSGWPQLQVNAFHGPEETLGTPLRMERISPNILIVLFSGLMNKVKIHLPPERLHFGFREEGDHKFSRPLRDLSGADLTTSSDGPVRPPIRPFGGDGSLTSDRTVDLGALFTSLGTSLHDSKVTSKLADFTHAVFALEMIEGVPLVSFTID